LAIYRVYDDDDVRVISVSVVVGVITTVHRATYLSWWNFLFVFLSKPLVQTYI